MGAGAGTAGSGNMGSRAQPATMMTAQSEAPSGPEDADPRRAKPIARDIVAGS